jgi:hypothetical protein
MKLVHHPHYFALPTLIDNAVTDTDIDNQRYSRWLGAQLQGTSDLEGLRILHFSLTTAANL